ncbi:MAG: glycosyltransferase, partial [Hyphomicrobiaceae bacterium]|nr:glycosyltransferase [Hyphomicrobiaceae bacterium]
MSKSASSELNDLPLPGHLAPGSAANRRLRIMHCLRAPVGGLFRHVRDLAQYQARQGHRVAVVCDDGARDGLTASRLDDLNQHLALGLTRTPMPRSFGWTDMTAYAHIRKHAHAMQIDVLHGHGAKGGAYARLAARTLKSRGIAIAAIYTPHGGSLHFDPRTPQGALFMAAERHLLRHTDAAIFESAFARDRFQERVADIAVSAPQCLSRVIHNGLADHEFTSHAPLADAADLLFVGELRHLKGVDVLIEAIAKLRQDDPARPLSALIVGDGPDRAAFEDLTCTRGLQDQITFAGAMP